MRWGSFLFLLLMAAHGASRGPQHLRVSLWHAPGHDGFDRRDFGRNLRHFDQGRSGADRPIDLGERHFAPGVQFQPSEYRTHRLDTFDISNGASLRVGLIQGHHPGIRFGIRF